MVGVGCGVCAVEWRWGGGVVGVVYTPYYCKYVYTHTHTHTHTHSAPTEMRPVHLQQQQVQKGGKVCLIMMPQNY
jgi:hypothetical protein